MLSIFNVLRFLVVCAFIISMGVSNTGRAMPPRKDRSSESEESASAQKQRGAGQATDGRVEMTLEQVWPESWNGEKRSIVTALIRSITTSSNPEPEGKAFGLSFQGDSSWMRLALAYLKEAGEAVPCGDWGGGKGHTSLALVLAGGHVNYLDTVRETAKQAIHTMKAARPHMGDGVKIKDVARFFIGDVSNPPAEFMDRQNFVNTAFQLFHYLSPLQADSFLDKLYENTQNGGYVIISTSAPNLTNPIEAAYYKKRKGEGERYPGYGMYTRSDCRLTGVGQLMRTRSVIPFTQEEQAENRFPMGFKGQGIFRPAVGASLEIEPTRVPKGTPESDPRNILQSTEYEYVYNSSHQPFNPICHIGLSDLLKERGFGIIGSYYTMNPSTPLYPLDLAINLSRSPDTYVAGVLVTVVQKR